MAGFLDTALQDIEQRIRELKDEVDKLEAARTALTGERSPRSQSAGRSRNSGSASPSTQSAPQRRRQGRARGRRSGNTRASQALDLVRSDPGITIPQLAAAMKIQPNYLYRVMPALEKDGSITRNGQGWFPAGTSA